MPQGASKDILDTVIVGAGIAGLTVGAELASKGRRVLVLERSDEPGGAVRTVNVDGFVVEEGPNSLLDTSPAVVDFLDRHGLASDRVFAREEAKKRYVVRRGRPIALPAGPIDFIKSALFGTRAKLHLLKEPFLPAWDNRYEESVAQFVRRRLGEEFLDYAINPFVAGVYAGDPEMLSVPHAFPKLHALEQRYGSLIKGQIRGAKERKQRAEKSKQSARMYSFKKGIGTLPRVLAENAGEGFISGYPISAISVDGREWTVTRSSDCGNTEDLRARSVVYTGRLTDLQQLRLRGVESHLTTRLGEVHYPPVTVLGLGYRQEQIGHPLDGFGVLVPEVEDKHVLGVLFSSTIFPQRAPDGHDLLTVFVGGTRRPDLALVDDDELMNHVRADLRDLLQVDGHPVIVHRRTWKHAIPQYAVGYGEILDNLQRIEDRHPGLFFAGNYRGGISVTDTLKSGLEMADRIHRFLA